MNKQISIRKASNGFIVQVGNPNPHINEAKEVLDQMTNLVDNVFGNREGEEWKDNLKKEGVAPVDINADGEYIFQYLGDMVSFIMDLFE